MQRAKKFAAGIGIAGLIGGAAIIAPAAANAAPMGDPGSIQGTVTISPVTTLSLSASSFTVNPASGQTVVSPEIDATVASNDLSGWTAYEALPTTFTGPVINGSAVTIPNPQWGVGAYTYNNGQGDDWSKNYTAFNAAGTAQPILTVASGDDAPNAFLTNWPDQVPGNPGQDNTVGHADYGDILFGVFNQLVTPGSQPEGTYVGDFDVTIIPA